MWRPDQLWEIGWVQSLGQMAHIVVPEVVHTCTTGCGRVISLIVLLSQTLCNFSGGQTAPQYNSPCKPHIGICLQFYGNSHTFPKTVEEVVPSRNRVKSKTKPEEPITPECGFSVNSVYSSKKRKLMDWGFAFRNSCRQRRSALLRRTDKLSKSVVGFSAERRE